MDSSPTAPENEYMMMIASPIRQYKTPVLHSKNNGDEHDINNDIDFSLSLDDIDDFSDTDSSEGDDSDDASSSSSSFSTDDTNHNHNRDSDTNPPSQDKKDSDNGLFLSLEMVKLLRKSSSEGNNIGSMLPQCLIDSMTPPAVAPSTTTTMLTPSGKSKPRMTSKHASIVFAIQDRSPTKNKSNGNNGKKDEHQSPKETIRQILLKHYNQNLEFQKYDTVPEDYFVRSIVSSSAQTRQLMTAVRDNDLDTIKHLHETAHCPLQCANHFQESIIHTVARRGHTELLQYLTTVAKLSLRVCCDGGRNALHDACWTGRPNFDMIQIFVNDSPDLLYLSDQRNNSPLDYIPKEAYAVWNTWLETNAHLLKPKVLLFK